MSKSHFPEIDMATKIGVTPVLYGKESEAFERRAQKESRRKKPTKKTIQKVKRALKTFLSAEHKSRNSN